MNLVPVQRVFPNTSIYTALQRAMTTRDYARMTERVHQIEHTGRHLTHGAIAALKDERPNLHTLQAGLPLSRPLD